MDLKRQLPRLDPAYYRGGAYVFWTYTLKNRATGWLDSEFAATFRVLLLHTLSRYRLSCPVYVLMPDHLHFIWIGAASDSDQLRASAFFRKALNAALAPNVLQRQPHDHVMREAERARDCFADTVGYIRMNPVRAGLVTTAGAWPYGGAMIPGYPHLAEGSADFWPTFWKCHYAYVKANESVRGSST